MATPIFSDLANALSRTDIAQFGPFAAAGVAAVAIWMTNKQTQRTNQTNARQAAIAEAKVRSDLFDRRYVAWMDLRKFAKSRYLAIHGMRAGDSQLDIYSDEDRSGFEAAAEQIFFLFGDDVNQAVTDLKASLSKFQVAKAMESSADNYERQVFLGNTTLEADQESDYALGNLKRLMKSYMEPSGPLR